MGLVSVIRFGQLWAMANESHPERGGRGLGGMASLARVVGARQPAPRTGRRSSVDEGGHG